MSSTSTNSSNEDSHDEIDYIQEERRKLEANMQQWNATCEILATGILTYYYLAYIHKTPCRTSIRTGSIFMAEILGGSEMRCYQNFRMYKDTFVEFSHDLLTHYNLEGTRGMSYYEQVGMFLMTCAHGVGNRIIQEMFNHSGETVHRHFHLVLEAVNRLASTIITPDPNYNYGAGFHTTQHSRYLPFFKDCIGAIDDTHVKARPLAEDLQKYVGRKGYPTQNVMAICDFNLCFTFVWAGWEGSAHDSRIFNQALLQPNINFPHPVNGKYYLVDAGYSHRLGYMGPYKGSEVRYHLEEFRNANTGRRRAPRSVKEKFNYLHSSCRNVIERTFGVWKARFLILEYMPPYPMDVQRDIVIATMAVHNYIRKKNCGDSAFTVAERENWDPSSSIPGGSHENEHEHAGGDDNNEYWNGVRHSISVQIANS